MPVLLGLSSLLEGRSSHMTKFVEWPVVERVPRRDSTCMCVISFVSMRHASSQRSQNMRATPSLITCSTHDNQQGTVPDAETSFHVYLVDRAAVDARGRVNPVFHRPQVQHRQSCVQLLRARIIQTPCFLAPAGPYRELYTHGDNERVRTNVENLASRCGHWAPRGLCSIYSKVVTDVAALVISTDSQCSHPTTGTETGNSVMIYFSMIKSVVTFQVEPSDVGPILRASCDSAGIHIISH